jgi:hypothetical protein
MLYGFGGIGQLIYSKLSDKIGSIVDKNYLNLAKEYPKIKFHSPEHICNFNFDKIIISVLGRENEICSLLQENFGISKHQMITLSIGSNFNNLYERIFVSSTYSPWKEDEKFLNLFQLIKNHTLVDIYRCFSLYELVQQSSKLQKGSIIEIGVWRGGTGTLIARTAQDSKIQEKVYLCDTFQGVVKSGEKDLSYNNGEHNDTSINIVENLVSTLKLRNIHILQGIFPDETGKELENQKFRFCHIDVDVYTSAKDILEWIWDKLVIGAIVVFDDYGFKSCSGITTFVNEQKTLPNRIISHNLNGQAIMIKIS